MHQLHGLPQFLNFVSSHPGPDAVAQAIIAGPLASLGATECSLATWVNARLETVGMSDDLHNARARPLAVPTNLDLPLVRALHTCEVVLVPMNRLLIEYPSLEPLTHIWGTSVPEGESSVLCSPVLSGGVSVGAWWCTLPEDVEFGPRETLLVQGISSALGLWLTHPKTLPLIPVESRQRTGEASLTDRQVQILILVRVGKTNREIGRALGFSESTIKGELRHLMDVFKLGNRIELAQRAASLGLLSPWDEGAPLDRVMDGAIG